MFFCNKSHVGSTRCALEPGEAPGRAHDPRQLRRAAAPPPVEAWRAGRWLPRASALDPEQLPRQSPNRRAPGRAAAGTPGLSPEGDPGPVAQPGV